MFERVVNLALRGTTLISKFAMIFCMAIFLAPAQVGLYGLLFSSIIYCIYFVGFDFYTYSTREIAAAPQDLWFTFLRDQSFFTLFAYVCVLPLLLLIFTFGLLPWSIAAWFFILLILEHLSQEINRLLIAMSKQLEASFVLFLRSGLWSVLVVVFMWIFPEYRDLKWVFVFWALGLVSAVGLGVFFLLRIESKRPFRSFSFEWVWTGVKVSIPLLIASLAIAGLFTFDRFFVKDIVGVEVLAAYVLFAGIANAIMAFIDAGVIVFFYPKVISAARNRHIDELISLITAMAKQVFLFGLFLSIMAFIFSHILVTYLKASVYAENIYFVYWLVASTFVYVVSLIPHLALYGLGKDRVIIYAQLVSLSIFLLGAFYLKDGFGVDGVLFALLFSCAVMGAIKAIFYFKCLRDMRYTR